jgi:uncharacterized protein (DUF849 family)
LIGRKGETLAALQYITRLIASRELQRRADIVIDVEGYKSRREQMLRKLAKRMQELGVRPELEVFDIGNIFIANAHEPEPDTWRLSSEARDDASTAVTAH